MQTDAFGLPKDTPSKERMEAAFGDEPPEEEVETEEVETEEVAPEEPPEPAPDEETAEEAEEEGEAEEGEALPRAFLNKYKTLEAAESAYNELRRTERDHAEQLRKAEEQNRQYEEYLRVAAQELQRRQQAVQAPAPTPTEVEALAQQYGVDPETFMAAQRIADERIQQAIAPFQQQQQQAQMQEYERAQYERDLAEVERVATTWVQDQEEPPEPETWRTMVEIFGELELEENYAPNYDVAREIASDPNLRTILRFSPNLVEEDGMETARKLASGINSDTQPPQKTRRTRPKAYVERGGSGAAPTPGASEDEPQDSWEAVKKLAASEQGRRASPLGV